jgi:hypothetical protein
MELPIIQSAMATKPFILHNTIETNPSRTANTNCQNLLICLRSLIKDFDSFPMIKKGSPHNAESEKKED